MSKTIYVHSKSTWWYYYKYITANSHHNGIWVIHGDGDYVTGPEPSYWRSLEVIREYWGSEGASYTWGDVKYREYKGYPASLLSLLLLRKVNGS